MCALYERISELCKLKGVTPSRMCLDLGMSKSTVSDIKSGRKNGLSASSANRIANYLGVTVGYLLGEETEKAPAESDRRLTETPTQNIICIAGRDGSYRERTVTDEQLALFAAMFDQLPDVPDNL